jgi:hypothetical protein
MAGNNLAWILATSGNDGVRDGAAAVEISSRLCQSGAGANQPIFWMTRGAALAESKRFEEAVKSANRALTLAETQEVKGSTLAELLAKQIRLFESRKPFREEN